MSSIYFGGSRKNNHPLVPVIVAAAVSHGHIIHVGCQWGIDAQVVKYTPLSSLVVFAVAQEPATAPDHLWEASLAGNVIFSAGGISAPITARYLLRSIAAFQGCEAAVFFVPGPGSLAVARECVRQGLPVFAFSQSAPAPVPSVSGQWVESSFMGFACWLWKAPNQLSLF